MPRSAGVHVSSLVLAWICMYVYNCVSMYVLMLLVCMSMYTAVRVQILRLLRAGLCVCVYVCINNLCYQCLRKYYDYVQECIYAYSNVWICCHTPITETKTHKSCIPYICHSRHVIRITHMHTHTHRNKRTYTQKQAHLSPQPVHSAVKSAPISTNCTAHTV
jgi:hypothetical protein